MQPSTGTFLNITDEQAAALQGHIDRGEDEETGLAKDHRKHGIKQAQIWRVGEVVKLKGADYRVKSIHTRTLVLTPCYP